MREVHLCSVSVSPLYIPQILDSAYAFYSKTIIEPIFAQDK